MSVVILGWTLGIDAISVKNNDMDVKARPVRLAGLSAARLSKGLSGLSRFALCPG